MNARKRAPKAPKILVCVPCLDKTDTEFVRCLTSLESVGDTRLQLMSGSLVYASRDKLAQQAIEGGYDYLMWLDSDMIFPPSLLRDLYADLQETGEHMICGIFFRRKPPYTPVIYKTIRLGLPGEGVSEEYLDYPKKSVFEVDACGFGAVLMSGKLLKDVVDANRTGFIPIPGYGEDISFCIRAKKLGYKILCDSRINVGHLSATVIDEDAYEQIKKGNAE